MSTTTLINTLNPSLVMAAGCALSATYYLLRVVEKPQVLCAKLPYNHSVLAKCPTLRRFFYPTPFCFNNHLQLISVMLKNIATPTVRFEREYITVECGREVVGLDWAVNTPEPTPDAPTVILLPGVTGCSRSLTTTVRSISKKGWRAVVLIRRGHGGMRLRAPKFNPVGDAHDLHACMLHIQDRLPASPLVLYGASAGSGTVVRYLGEYHKEAAHLAAAVCVSPAYDISVSMARIRQPYRNLLARQLKSHFIHPNHTVFSSRHPTALDGGLQAKDVVEFLQQAHALFGYESYEEFLRGSNPMEVAHNITVPLLCINAHDDPICTSENVVDHHWLFEHLPTAILVTTQRGSHCAFYEGLTMAPWADRVAVEYVQAVLDSVHIRPCTTCEGMETQADHLERELESNCAGGEIPRVA